MRVRTARGPDRVAAATRSVRSRPTTTSRSSGPPTGQYGVRAAGHRPAAGRSGVPRESDAPSAGRTWLGQMACAFCKLVVVGLITGHDLAYLLGNREWFCMTLKVRRQT